MLYLPHLFVVGGLPRCQFYALIVCPNHGRASEDNRMRRDELISREEVMSPDLLSEVVLLGTGVAVTVAFIMVVIAASASAAIQ